MRNPANKPIAKKEGIEPGKGDPMLSPLPTDIRQEFPRFPLRLKRTGMLLAPGLPSGKIGYAFPMSFRFPSLDRYSGMGAIKGPPEQGRREANKAL